MKDIKYGDVLTANLLGSIIKDIDPAAILNRKSKTGAIVKISPNLRKKPKSITKLLKFGQYNRVVEEYKEIFDSKLSHCNNNAFYEHIKKLQIREIEEFDNPKQEGEYCLNTNTILLKLESLFKSDSNEIEKHHIFHELIHMSTSYQKKLVKMIGFEQYQPGRSYGKGISEGYTELINQRYFDKYNLKDLEDGIPYLREQMISYGIELIVGREKMEQLFFDADLDGLIKEMAKYMPLSSARAIVDETDKIPESSNQIGKNEIQYSISAYLTNVYLKKQFELFQAGQITEEQFQESRMKALLYSNGYIIDKQDKGYLIDAIIQVVPCKISDDEYTKISDEVDFLNTSQRAITNSDCRDKTIIDGVKKVLSRERNKKEEIVDYTDINQTPQQEKNELEEMLKSEEKVTATAQYIR